MRESLTNMFAGGDYEQAYQKLKSDVTAKVCSCSTEVKGEEIDDIVQDAAIKLILSIDRYDSEKGRVSTFRDHIITNVLIDRIRRWRSFSNRSVVYDSEMINHVVDDRCEKVDFDMDFERWFDTLSHVEQQIVRMRLDGKNNTTIARELGCSNSSITTYRQAVRKKWNRFFCVT